MTLRIWGWISFGVFWLAGAVTLVRIGFGIAILTSKVITPPIAAMLVAFLFQFILWGWIIPLSLGLKRLITTNFSRRVR